MPEFEHADQPTMVLLCGAPGTSISKIAASLGDGDKTKVWDLETEICNDCRETTEGGKQLAVPRMSDVIMRGRRELRELWTTAYQRIAQGISKSSDNTHIVCMHLTWYNAEWQEFYSPINLLSLSANGRGIDHVVILIDDVYDMFSRLHEDLYLYDEKNLERAIDTIRKLSTPDRTSNSDGSFDEHFTAQLRAQAVESAMVDLLAWRRAEIIQAENIARTLDCDLTILATKHSRAALRLLVTGVGPPRVYLSHRISELRRANLPSRSAKNPFGSWSPLAYEVNDLHHALAAEGQVLINPTAIDELRFENDPDSGRRKPTLTPRWPVPSDGLLTNQADGSYHHTNILRGSLPDDDEIASHAARSLSIRVSYDVWFRDHAIVEHTPNLCIYRPFYSEDSPDDTSRANWSGGVGDEMTHWINYFTEYAATLGGNVSNVPRRVAIVHSETEIKNRCSYLITDGRDEFDRSVYRHMSDVLSAGLSAQTRTYRLALEKYRGAYESAAGQTSLDPSDFEQFVLQNTSAIYSGLRPALQASLHHAFTRLDRTQPESNVLLLSLPEAENGRLEEFDELVGDLCNFFAGGMDELEIRRLNGQFWQLCEGVFRQAAEMRIELYALRAAKMDTEGIRQALTLDP